MAVEVTIPKPASSNTIQQAHERGGSYAVQDGVLYVFDNESFQSPDRQVAVYAAGQWLSAVVTKG